MPDTLGMIRLNLTATKIIIPPYTPGNSCQFVRKYMFYNMFLTQNMFYNMFFKAIQIMRNRALHAPVLTEQGRVGV
jgi:hypothetical protein